MYFAEKNLIFVHIPKTAGNFVQSHVQHFSHDRIIATGHQDGVQRFEVIGKFTVSKHATLDNYRVSLGDVTFAAAKVFTCVRHPVDRCLSLYFSPHRWRMLSTPRRIERSIRSVTGMRCNFGPEDYVQRKPVFSLAKFEKLVRESKTMASYLTVDGAFQKPDDIIRYENICADTERVFAQHGFSAPQSWERINASTEADQLDKLKREPQVWRIVEAYHGIDFKKFGY